MYSWRNTCTVVRTKSCCYRAAADVWASARRLARCLRHARLYWEEKHKADCRARMDHLETIILRKSILRPSVLSLDSSPCPSVPISSLKVVYWSCLFFGIISVGSGRIYIIGLHCLLNYGGWRKSDFLTQQSVHLVTVLSFPGQMSVKPQFWHLLSWGIVNCNNLEAVKPIACQCVTCQVSVMAVNICSFWF